MHDNSWPPGPKTLRKTIIVNPWCLSALVAEVWSDWKSGLRMRLVFVPDACPPKVSAGGRVRDVSDPDEG
jgi:hypothetical protein